VVDGVATTWFDAPSLIEGAALAGRIVELSAEILVDLRATGFGLGRIRPRLYSNDLARPGTLSLDASGHYLRGA